MSSYLKYETSKVAVDAAWIALKLVMTICPCRATHWFCKSSMPVVEVGVIDPSVVYLTF